MCGDVGNVGVLGVPCIERTALHVQTRTCTMYYDILRFSAEMSVYLCECMKIHSFMRSMTYATDEDAVRV